MHRAGHRDQHTTATWSPAAQPAGRSLGTTPQNHSEELPPHPRTATLPQTRSLDLQVIQGQAGARLVHGVVGDCDACRKAQEKTRECESELTTENLAPNLRGPGSACEEGFPTCSLVGPALSEATKHLKVKLSLIGRQTHHKPRCLQAALWDILPQPRSHSQAVWTPAPAGHWPAWSNEGRCTLEPGWTVT